MNFGGRRINIVLQTDFNHHVIWLVSASVVSLHLFLTPTRCIGQNITTYTLLYVLLRFESFCFVVLTISCTLPSHPLRCRELATGILYQCFSDII